MTDLATRQAASRKAAATRKRMAAIGDKMREGAPATGSAQVRASIADTLARIRAHQEGRA